VYLGALNHCTILSIIRYSNPISYYSINYSTNPTIRRPIKPPMTSIGDFGTTRLTKQGHRRLSGSPTFGKFSKHSCTWPRLRYVLYVRTVQDPARTATVRLAPLSARLSAYKVRRQVYFLFRIPNRPQLSQEYRFLGDSSQRIRIRARCATRIPLVRIGMALIRHARPDVRRAGD